jgi:hypothetical protein
VSDNDDSDGNCDDDDNSDDNDDDDDDDVFLHSQSPYSNILVSRIIRFIFVTLIIFFLYR